jgi:hypothetical protein
MRERAVPTENLNSKREGEARKMKNSYDLVFDSPKAPDEKEDDPEKMGQDNDVRKNLIEHLSNRP